ncbi:MAG TPA: lipocalin family protein [Luteimonas sp.]|nr:lipocalin family protein [Luteimonas sp.]
MRHSDLATVPSIDLPRYLGLWYEIARLPMRHEPEDYTDITAEYALQDDGNIRVVNRAIDGRGERQEAVGEATAVDASNSRLEVTFLPQGLRWIPFTKGDYWIIHIDSGYSAALVGSPDRRYLWLLSRTPRIEPAMREAFLARAREQGFDLAELIETPQSAAF